MAPKAANIESRAVKSNELLTSVEQEMLADFIRTSDVKLRPDFAKVAAAHNLNSANTAYHRFWRIQRKLGLTGTGTPPAKKRGTKRKVEDAETDEHFAKKQDGDNHSSDANNDGHPDGDAGDPESGGATTSRRRSTSRPIKSTKYDDGEVTEPWLKMLHEYEDSDDAYKNAKDDETDDDGEGPESIKTPSKKQKNKA